MAESKQGSEAPEDADAADSESSESEIATEDGEEAEAGEDAGAKAVEPEEDIDATLEDAEAIDALLAAREAARADSRRKAGEAPAASGAPIPAPRIDTNKQRARRGLDVVTVLAMLAFVLVGGLLVFGYAQALLPAAEAQLGAACRPLNPEPREGAAPALELEDLDGNPVSLEDFRGKFVVLNFWATWCEPCTREWPDLAILGQRMSERDDVVVLAVGLDEDKQDIAPYLERMGLGDTAVRVLWSKDPEAYKAYGSEKIPDTYFVNSEGELEAVFVNVRKWGKAGAVRCVEASADH